MYLGIYPYMYIDFENNFIHIRYIYRYLFISRIKGIVLNRARKKERPRLVYERKGKSYASIKIKGKVSIYNKDQGQYLQ